MSLAQNITNICKTANIMNEYKNTREFYCWYKNEYKMN